MTVMTIREKHEKIMLLQQTEMLVTQMSKMIQDAYQTAQDGSADITEALGTNTFGINTLSTIKGVNTTLFNDTLKAGFTKFQRNYNYTSEHIANVIGNLGTKNSTDEFTNVTCQKNIFHQSAESKIFCNGDFLGKMSKIAENIEKYTFQNASSVPKEITENHIDYSIGHTVTNEQQVILNNAESILKQMIDVLETSYGEVRNGGVSAQAHLADYVMSIELMNNNEGPKSFSDFKLGNGEARLPYDIFTSKVSEKLAGLKTGYTDSNFVKTIMDKVVADSAEGEALLKNLTIRCYNDAPADIAKEYCNKNFFGLVGKLQTEVKEEQKTGVKEEQKTGVKEEQKIGVKEEQKIGVKEEQKIEVKEEQKTGVKEEQKIGVKEEQKIGVKEEQKIEVKEEQKTGVKEEQKIGVKEEQKIEVKEEQKTGVKEEQKIGVKEEQKIGVKEEQKIEVKEEQKTGVKEEQKTGVKEEQKTGVKEEQKIGVKEEQKIEVKEELQTEEVKAEGQKFWAQAKDVLKMIAKAKADTDAGVSGSCYQKIMAMIPAMGDKETANKLLKFTDDVLKNVAALNSDAQQCANDIATASKTLLDSVGDITVHTTEINTEANRICRADTDINWTKAMIDDAWFLCDDFIKLAQDVELPQQ
ncbi:hypothetical protein MIDIC_230087 [Alphaproteobacteria bacterium]